MSQNTIILIAVIVLLVLVALVWLLKGRKQHVTFEAKSELPPMAPPAPKAPIATPAPSPVPAADEGHGVGSEVAAAIEDVIDQFVGIDAHESGQGSLHHHGDALSRLKGLGPKAESRLHEIGVTTFAQIAAWDEGDIDAIDAQMGAFKGRIRRDRWVEQAKLLAKGDIASFEEAFGKLG